MSVEQNKAIVRRFIHEVMMGGDLELLDQIVSPECVNHAAVPEARFGTEGIKRVVRGSRIAQPTSAGRTS